MTTIADKPNVILIRGQVIHERLRPAAHRFVYPVFYLRLNLDQLAQIRSKWFGINRRRLVSLQTRDYGPRDGRDLSAWMRTVLRDADLCADGEIWLQTFPRMFGYVFNPVSFWYCYDRSGALRAVLAEVNNTFGETHRYLIAAADGLVIHADTVLNCRKLLHVSPFCEVQGTYHFRFIDVADHAITRIDYSDDVGLLIKTIISGKTQAMTDGVLLKAVFAQPLLTFGVVFRIHWQAIKLWRKRVPFYSKPVAPLQPISTSQEYNNHGSH
jgi:DUF1365 family protein